jgi:hypothetical protein
MCIEADKHVYSEKPLAMQWEAARELTALRCLQPQHHGAEGLGMRESAELAKKGCLKRAPRSNMFSCAARLACRPGHHRTESSVLLIGELGSRRP